MIPIRDVDHLDARALPESHARTIRETPHSRLPLIDGDWGHLDGVVLVREVLADMLDGNLPLLNLRQFARAPLTVPASQHVARLLETMRGQHAQMAFVANDHGKLVGLVTLGDVVDAIVADVSTSRDAAERAGGPPRR